MKKVRWIVVMMEMESGCHGCARDGKEMVRALAGTRGDRGRWPWKGLDLETASRCEEEEVYGVTRHGGVWANDGGSTQKKEMNWY